MVTLEKERSEVRDEIAGVGMNDGPARVAFIGRIPTRRVNGPLIITSGMRVRVPAGVGIPGPSRVRAVAVAIEPDGYRDRGQTAPSYIGTVFTADGAEYVTGPRGSMADVRLAWLRLVVESGTFAGIARMS